MAFSSQSQRPPNGESNQRYQDRRRFSRARCLARLDDHAHSRALLVVDHDFREKRNYDDVNMIVGQIPSSNGNGFDGLVHGPGPNSLDFGVVMLSHNSGDSPCDSG